ncbi:MAG TPA: cyclophane-forming radical SAM/SPASM peptide maturase YhhB [Thermoanaerobaculia bacterium]|jgi:uncharacterized protein|nr:cyclophane-forming radical SAM/SPASM peptide maturase YhhB [Thermoanaerobaculia bacterium]
MVEVDTVLLKVASRCNIDCRYCYVYNMGDSGWSRVPKHMSRETCRATAAALACLAREQGRPFALVLHGGEPLLLGATNLEYVILTLREALPAECAISIQTNGILVSREILDLCAGARVTLSVSLDGPRHVHDRNRVGFDGEGTFDKVLEGIERLRAHSDSCFLFTGLLAVIDPESDPREVYTFFKDLGPPSVDFIYKDGNHSRLPEGKASASTTEYGRWMAALLDIYLADDTPIRIRILDDMIKLVLGGVGSKDGVGLTNYGVLIVDADGSVTKNDTLKSSFDGADRFPVPWSIHTHSLGDILRSVDFAEYQAMQRPSNPICLSCPELSICGGGMTLQRWRDGNGYDNPSVYCEDQKLLIGRIREKVAALGAVV